MIIALLLAAADPVGPPVTCTDAADCAKRWDRAVEWVYERNPSITEKTDTFLQTAPIERTGVDRYQLLLIGNRIRMSIECANMFACRWKKRFKEFADHVNGVDAP